MKTIFCFIGLMIFGNAFSQDTLVQTNGNECGAKERYVLYVDGTFKYLSIRSRTGFPTYGEGTYKRTKRKIKFDFCPMDSLVANVVCVNNSYNDSASILTFNVFDSSKVDCIVGYDSIIGRPSPNGMYSRGNSVLNFKAIGGGAVNVNIDSTCSEYKVYLVLNHNIVTGDIHHVLKSTLKGWRRKIIYIYGHIDNAKKVYKHDFELRQTD